MSSQIIMHTSNPIHENEIVWTIENFAGTPDVLKGPHFEPFPGSLTKTYLEIDWKEKNLTKGEGFCWLYLWLRFDEMASHTNLSGNVQLINSSDGILSQCSTNTNLDRFGVILIMHKLFLVNHKHELNTSGYCVRDKLVVKCKFLFTGWKINNSIYSVVKNSCEEFRELGRDFKNLFKNGYTHDVTFTVADKSIRAHKAILCSRSPVFSKMFLHDMAESNSNSIVIKDANFHVFECFLLFLYSDEIEDKEWNTVVSLYSLADKYQVDSLRRRCSQILRSEFTHDSVCSVLALSYLHNDDDLKEAAIVHIKRNFSQVVNSSDWEEILTSNPKLASEILKRITSLNVV